MTAPRRPTLAERVDVLYARVLSLEAIVGLEKIEAEVLRRIAAERQAEAPAKTPTRKREASR